MVISRIHRYILHEVSVPMLLSLLIFTFVLVMGRIPQMAELVVNKGVPATEISQLFSYLLPTFFSITVPLAFLLGILLAFGRLSAESEFVALKASGVSLYTLLKPVLAIAVLCTLLTAWITISAEPAGKRGFRNKLFEIVASKATVGIKPGIFNDDFEGIVLYTQEMDERTGVMRGVFISDERDSGVPTTILAQEGRFIPDPGNLSLTLNLKNGEIHRQPETTGKTTYQIIGFTNYNINLETGNKQALQNRPLSRGALPWAELVKSIETTDNPRIRRSHAAEMHKRVAIAFAPLVFALVGVPLGLQSTRSGKGAGFTLALAIALTYYLLLSIASTLASKGILPAALALWLPNFGFLAGGLYFLHRTAIEQPFALLAQPGRLWQKWRRKGKSRATSQNA